MAAKYGCDISGPATNAQEAIQWTYFGYPPQLSLRTVQQCPSVAYPPSPDAYIERDLKAGKITEQDAQEMIDHRS